MNRITRSIAAAALAGCLAAGGVPAYAGSVSSEPSGETGYTVTLSQDFDEIDGIGTQRYRVGIDFPENGECEAAAGRLLVAIPENFRPETVYPEPRYLTDKETGEERASGAQGTLYVYGSGDGSGDPEAEYRWETDEPFSVDWQEGWGSLSVDAGPYPSGFCIEGTADATQGEITVWALRQDAVYSFQYNPSTGETVELPTAYETAAALSITTLPAESAGESPQECAHEWEASVTDPSCEEGGRTDYACSICGEAFSGCFTEPLGHDWGEPDEDGIRRCMRCGAEEAGEDAAGEGAAENEGGSDAAQDPDDAGGSGDAGESEGSGDAADPTGGGSGGYAGADGSEEDEGNVSDDDAGSGSGEDAGGGLDDDGDADRPDGYGDTDAREEYADAAGASSGEGAGDPSGESGGAGGAGTPDTAEPGESAPSGQPDSSGYGESDPAPAAVDAASVKTGDGRGFPGSVPAALAACACAAASVMRRKPEA